MNDDDNDDEFDADNNNKYECNNIVSNVHGILKI